MTWRCILHDRYATLAFPFLSDATSRPQRSAGGLMCHFFYLLHWNQWPCLFVFVTLFSHLFQRSPWTTICILEGLFFICSCLSTGLVTFWLLVNLQGRIDKVGCTLRDFDNFTSSQPSDAAWHGFHNLWGRRELSCLLLAGREAQTESQLAKSMNKRQSAQEASGPECHLCWLGGCGWSQQPRRGLMVTCLWLLNRKRKIKQQKKTKRFTSNTETREKAKFHSWCSGKVENHTVCSWPKWFCSILTNFNDFIIKKKKMTHSVVIKKQTKKKQGVLISELLSFFAHAFLFAQRRGFFCLLWIDDMFTVLYLSISALYPVYFVVRCCDICGVLYLFFCQAV